MGIKPKPGALKPGNSFILITTTSSRPPATALALPVIVNTTQRQVGRRPTILELLSEAPYNTPIEFLATLRPTWLRRPPRRRPSR
jgi:hypothetical protein